MAEWTDLWQTSLEEMIEESGEENVKSILSGFSCSLNPDVEHFLRSTAIEFAKKRTGVTYLVFRKQQDKMDLVGYYALANKCLIIHTDGLSKSTIKRLERYGTTDDEGKTIQVAMPLIGQLGKNEAYREMISGSDLLQMACAKVYDAQRILGGRYVYLECEDKEVLTEFYNKNGFIEFGRRAKDGDEGIDGEKKYLKQMLKCLNDEEYAEH